MFRIDIILEENKIGELKSQTNWNSGGEAMSHLKKQDGAVNHEIGWPYLEPSP